MLEFFVLLVVRRLFPPGSPDEVTPVFYGRSRKESNVTNLAELIDQYLESRRRRNPLASVFETQSVIVRRYGEFSQVDLIDWKRRLETLSGLAADIHGFALAASRELAIEALELRQRSMLQSAEQTLAQPAPEGAAPKAATPAGLGPQQPASLAPPADARPAAPTEPAEDNALRRLGAVYGPVIERLAELRAVLDSPTLTVAEKLERLAALAPIPPDKTADEIAAMLGCNKGSVIRSDWWRRRMNEHNSL